MSKLKNFCRCHLLQAHGVAAAAVRWRDVRMRRSFRKTK